MKNPWVIIGIITIVLFGSAIFASSKTDEKNNEGVEIKQYIKGNSEAKVKLVEYSDFQCPACANFQPVLSGVLDQFPEDVSLEFKHFPLYIHPYAKQAAVAAEAAGQQGKFFEFHDMLYDNQQEWSSSATPSTFFVKYAGELDLDIDQFRRQMKSTLLQEKVKAEFNEGRTAGISGTPTLFLNGEKMDFQSIDQFIEQVTLAVDPNLASTTEAVGNQGGPKVKFGI